MPRAGSCTAGFRTTCVACNIRRGSLPHDMCRLQHPAGKASARHVSHARSCMEGFRTSCAACNIRCGRLPHELCRLQHPARNASARVVPRKNPVLQRPFLRGGVAPSPQEGFLSTFCTGRTRQEAFRARWCGEHEPWGSLPNRIFPWPKSQGRLPVAMMQVVQVPGKPSVRDFSVARVARKGE